MLKAWWNRYEPEATFVRTPGSGGWTTRQQSEQDTFHTGADIVTSSKTFPFAVEVKHRENWSYANFLEGKKSPARAWWDQAVRQADNMGKLPMLLCRRNRNPWLVVLDREAFETCEGSLAQYVATPRPCAVVAADYYFNQFTPVLTMVLPGANRMTIIGRGGTCG